MNSLNRLSSSLRAVWKERNGVRKGDETDLSETQDEFQQEVRGKPKAGSRTTRGWVSFEGCMGGLWGVLACVGAEAHFIGIRALRHQAQTTTAISRGGASNSMRFLQVLRETTRLSGRQF